MSTMIQFAEAQPPEEIFKDVFEGRYKPYLSEVALTVTDQELTAEFVEALGKIPKLDAIVFSRCRGPWNTLRLLQRCETLTSIVILHCEGFNDEGMKAIGGIPNLEQFHVMWGNEKITHEGSRELLRLKHLKAVTLPLGMMAIPELKRKFTDLKVRREGRTPWTIEPPLTNPDFRVPDLEDVIVLPPDDPSDELPDLPSLPTERHEFSLEP